MIGAGIIANIGEDIYNLDNTHSVPIIFAVETRVGRWLPADQEYKNFVFGCAIAMGSLDLTFPSIIEENGTSKLEKTSRTGWERRDVSLMPLEAPNAPEIRQTSAADQRENYEKYSSPVSAAIKTS